MPTSRVTTSSTAEAVDVPTKIDLDRDPLELFGEWLDLAHTHELNDANAMSIASVDARGLPNVRIVLLKDFDQEGFIFYTNVESQKGRELGQHHLAAAVFHWKSLRRQVRLRGSVSRASLEEADEYFASRSRASQIGAWASAQSRPLDGREVLLERYASERSRFERKSIPRPAHWSGFRIHPVYLEFWIEREHRLHDRAIFTRDDMHSAWSSTNFFP